jgi:hypothetical protein
MTMITTDTTKKKRPRATRYSGREIREVLIPHERDEWVNRQMSAKWSRSQVIDQCIQIAMGKVDAAAQNEDAIATSLAKMQTDIDKLTEQLRMVLAVLTVDAKTRYPAAEGRAHPTTFPEYRQHVLATSQRMKGGAE